MNASRIGRLLVLATALATSLTGASAGHAGQPVLGALVGAPGCIPGCGHVLDLIARYGGLNGALFNGPLANGKLGAAGIVGSPFGDFVLPADTLGDLAIASVCEAPATADDLPTFVVGVTNTSCRAVCNVQVSLVALLGPIRACDPTAAACLAEVPAGATVEVAITLPAEALAMGDNGGCPVGFRKLLVAIDSLDAFAELDETNNLQLLCRADIPQQVVAVEPAVAPEVGVAPPATVTPAQPAAPSLDSALEEFGFAGATAASSL